MSNRVFTSRLDFSRGWVIRDQRYAVPGAPAEMYNTQLDLLSEGALRQCLGAVPFAFKGDIGSDGQLWGDTGSGRYPGLSLIAKLKDGDEGASDTIVVADNVAEAGAYDTTNFYWLTKAATTSRQMTYPWGSTISVSAKGGVDQRFYYGDIIFLMGEERDDYPMTVSLASGTGTVGAYGTGQFTLNMPTVFTTTLQTATLLFTHTVTGETGSMVFGVNTFVDYEPSNQYSVSHGSAFPDSTFPANTSSQFQLYDRDYSPVNQNEEWYLTKTGYNKAGAFMEGLETPFFSHRLYYGTTYSKQYWDSNQNWLTNQVAWDSDTTTVIGTTTLYHYLPSAPVRDQNLTYGVLGMGMGMELVNTVGSLSQSKIGPTGIWKSATMNGKAYFFNGYSGTAFSLDVDDPTSVGVIGLERLDASAMTATESTIKENNSPPRGRYKYWVSYINEDGEESGLSTPAGGIGPVNIRNNYYSEVRSIPSGPATGTGIVYLYRSLNNDFSPFFLKRLKASQEGASPGDTLSYDDKIPDDELGDLPWAHGDLPPYDLFSPVVYYDRLWGLGTRPDVDGAARTTLFWSDINNPESWWWDGNWANVYGDDGDEVTCLVRDKTGLLVFKNNHLYLMSGRTPEEISFVEITVEDSDTGVGTPHPNAVAATDFGVFFYWNRGVYRYLQGNVQKVSAAIAPLLEGRQDIFNIDADDSWPYFGRPYGWSVTMNYDQVSQVLYFGCQGDFPNVIYDTSDVTEVSNNEITCMLDVIRARWIGMYSYHFGLIQRANLSIYDTWADGATTLSTGNGLIGALMSHDDGLELGFSTHHPLLFTPNTSLMNSMKINSKTKFRPIIGQLGPYNSKRFLYVDYLVDEQGIDSGSTNSPLTSKIYLDAATTGSASTLTVGGGAVYSNQIRHVYGLIGSEIEAEIIFDPDKHGDNFRLFEYSVGWQNLGREKAEHPGSAPTTPAGGPGWTSPPVSLGSPKASR